jgi:tetratricopeptide (TPR) repeat protein
MIAGSAGSSGAPLMVISHRLSKRLPDRWALLLLLLITLVVMGGVCFNQFTIWDDSFDIRQNAALLPPTVASMVHVWTTPTFALYIPVTYNVWGIISWATQFKNASGHIEQVPWAFHAVNLCVHLVAVALAFRVLRLLGLERFPCFCGALLFAVHPIQVEAVAWASGLKDVLAGAFSLAAVEQYLLYAGQAQAAPRPGAQRSFANWHYAGALVAFVGAILSKPAAMMLPFIVAAVDRWAAGRSWRKVLPPAAAWLVVAIPLAVVARLHQDATNSPHVPAWTRPLIAADSIDFYLGKLAWPFDLTVDYGHSPASIVASGRCYWDWLFPALVAFALFAGRRQRPLPWLAGQIFVLGSLPTIGLSESGFQFYSTTADHYLYFPLFGAALALAWFLNAYPTIAWRSLALLALLACCGLSSHQVGYWKDDEALWKHQIAVNPDSFLGFTNLGVTYINQNQAFRAIGLLNHGVALASPSRVKESLARNALSNALHQVGRLDEAIAQKRQTLSIERNTPGLQLDWERHTAELGEMLCEAGRYGEAVPCLTTAHACAPNDPKVTSLLKSATSALATQARHKKPD